MRNNRSNEFHKHRLLRVPRDFHRLPTTTAEDSSPWSFGPWNCSIASDNSARSRNSQSWNPRGSRNFDCPTCPPRRASFRWRSATCTPFWSVDYPLVPVFEHPENSTCTRRSNWACSALRDWGPFVHIRDSFACWDSDECHLLDNRSARKFPIPAGSSASRRNCRNRERSVFHPLSARGRGFSSSTGLWDFALFRRLRVARVCSCSDDSGTRSSPGCLSVSTFGPAFRALGHSGSAAVWTVAPTRKPASGRLLFVC